MSGPGAASTQGSLISSQVTDAHDAAIFDDTSLPQLQTLLDAESISPRQATAMADEASSMPTTVEVTSPAHSSNSTLLETVVEGNGAVLGSDTKSPQGQAVKVGTISEHAGVQQQQQSSPDVMSTAAAVQLVQSSGDILEVAIAQQSADVQDCGSRQMSEDSVRGPRSTPVEVSSFLMHVHIHCIAYQHVLI